MVLWIYHQHVRNINKIIETVELAKKVHDKTYIPLTRRENISDIYGFTFFDVLYEVVLKDEQAFLPQTNIIEYLRNERKYYDRRRDALELSYVSCVCDFTGEKDVDKRLRFFEIKDMEFHLLEYDKTDQRFWNIFRNQMYRYAPFVYFIKSISQSPTIQRELERASSIGQARKITMKFGLPSLLFSRTSIECGSEVFLKWGKELKILDENYQLTKIGNDWINVEPWQMFPPKIFIWNLRIIRSDTASAVSKRPNLNRSFVDNYLRESAILRRTTLIMYLAKNREIGKNYLRRFYEEIFGIDISDIEMVLSGDIEIMKRILYLEENEDKISIPEWLTIAEHRLKENIRFYQYKSKAHIIEDYIDEANRIITDFERYIMKRDRYPTYTSFDRSQFNNSTSGSREFRIGNKLRIIFDDVRIGKGNLIIPTSSKTVQRYLTDNPDFYHPVSKILFDIKGSVFTKGYGRPDLMNKTAIEYSESSFGIFVFVSDIPKESQAFEDVEEYERVYAMSELFLDKFIEKMKDGEFDKNKVYDFLKRSNVLNSELI